MFPGRGRLRTRVSSGVREGLIFGGSTEILTESTKMAARGSVEMNEAEALRLSIEAELMNLTVEGLYQVAQEAGADARHDQQRHQRARGHQRRQ